MGMTVSFAFMALIGVGQTVYNNQGKLPIQSLSLNGTCPAFDTSAAGWDPAWLPWKERGDNGLTQLFTISPLWYPCYGTKKNLALNISTFHRSTMKKIMEL